MKKSIVEKINDRIKEHGVKYKIQQICLDEIQITSFTTEVNHAIEMCAKISYLTLCSCNLKSLNNFPNLQSLISLDLSNNLLEGQSLEHLAKYNKMYSLILDNNKIADYSWLKYFKRMKLTELSLKGNPIAEDIQYREKIYKFLGSDLQILDGLDRNDNKKEQSESSSIIEADQQQQIQDSQQGNGQQSQQNDDMSESQFDSLNKKVKKQQQI